MDEGGDFSRALGRLEGQQQALAGAVEEGFRRMEAAISENRRSNKDDFAVVHTRITALGQRADANVGEVKLHVATMKAQQGVLAALARNPLVMTLLGALLATLATLGTLFGLSDKGG